MIDKILAVVLTLTIIGDSVNCSSWFGCAKSSDEANNITCITSSQEDLKPK